MFDHESANRLDLVPLFPLGVVLMPGQAMPLHIFEERYRNMVSDCLDNDNGFGIVFASGKRVHKTGCTARIAELVKRYEDGRFDILAVGERRFTIEDVDASNPLLKASIRFLDDEDEPFDEEVLSLARRGYEVLTGLARLAGNRGYISEEFLRNPRSFSFSLSGIEGLSLESRQTLLEMTSTKARLAAAVPALETLYSRLEFQVSVGGLLAGIGPRSPEAALLN